MFPFCKAKERSQLYPRALFLSQEAVFVVVYMVELLIPQSKGCLSISTLHNPS